jgi:hypothetical protein
MNEQTYQSTQPFELNMPLVGGYHNMWCGPQMDTAYHVDNVSIPEETKEKVNALTAQAGAIKFDQGKTDWAILPIGASEEIIKVFKFGEAKYSRGNYLDGNGLEYSRVLNSLLRHIHAFMRGEDSDPETGISHMAHAGCNIYMLLTYELNKQKFNNDDRAEKIIA